MKEIELKGLKETIYFDKTSTGLPIYVWKNERVKGVFSALCVNYGSIDQEFKINGKNKYYKVPSGIAHFIEHLNFYESENTTATDFYSKYGSEVNAFTTFNYTCYHVYSTNSFKENLNHLLDFVLTPFFNKKMLNKERNIIVEELESSIDYPDTLLYFEHYKNLFHKYKYKEMITGTKEDVMNTKLEDIELIYNTFYHPKNMFLVVCGNVSVYDVFKYAEENLKNKKILPFKNPKVKKYREESDVVCKYREIESNVVKAKLKMSIKIPLSNFKNQDPVKLRLMSSLIMYSNFGPTSDLKEELMEKELIDTLRTSREFIMDYLLLTVYIETDYQDEVIKIIKEQFKNLKMTEENLKRKINCLVASLVLDYDDIMVVSDSIQQEILSFNEIIANKKELLESITIEEINKVIKKIDVKNMAITVLKPK